MGGKPPVVMLPDALKRAIAIKRKWASKAHIKHWKIVRGDRVEIISGAEKGKQGIVKTVIRSQARVIVQGRNTRNRQVATGPPDKFTGEIPKRWTRLESPVHYSNIMLVDPANGLPSRVNERNLNGKRVRVSARSGAIIPKPELSQIYQRNETVNEKTDTPPEHVLAKTYVPPDPSYLAYRLQRLSMQPAAEAGSV
mmetsp:Transcript_30139/g.42037  ORF Transcript_30139/g.42037 Transcript_30139/m.42037 type:complete len:196 (-) Transcript_30139:200-787(-)